MNDYQSIFAVAAIVASQELLQDIQACAYCDPIEPALQNASTLAPTESLIGGASLCEDQTAHSQDVRQTTFEAVAWKRRAHCAYDE